MRGIKVTKTDIDSVIKLMKDQYGDQAQDELQISKTNIFQMQEVLKTEYECVCRNCEGCDKDCYHCDLVLDADYIKTAYKMMQTILSFIDVVDENL